MLLQDRTNKRGKVGRNKEVKKEVTAPRLTPGGHSILPRAAPLMVPRDQLVKPTRPSCLAPSHRQSTATLHLEYNQSLQCSSRTPASDLVLVTAQLTVCLQSVSSSLTLARVVLSVLVCSDCHPVLSLNKHELHYSYSDGNHFLNIKVY